ncbi:hypothetical protein A9Q96_03750 [Rhodobacterales bacterium 52_120_T64]|nr:hypothetical protein A9Q96_03750 [Rhodobacterales bacterium 52_120_T64]
MGDNNILPKGGFLRGVLAGLTLVTLIFIGLAVTFPINVATGPAPTEVSEANIAPVQPVLEPQESTDDISLNVDAPKPAQPAATPAPLTETAPIVAIAPETSAPVSIGSRIDDTSNNDVQIGGNESALPAVVVPSVPAIAAPVIALTPTVEETTQAPAVSVEINSGSAENDTTTLPRVAEAEPVAEGAIETPVTTDVEQEPLTGVGLVGQTLITSDEPMQVEVAESVESSVPDTAFGAFSAEFSDDTKLPLMSFILLANTVAEADVVAGFSTQITLAVASDNAAANDVVSTYRASGGEVVLLLPNGGGNALRKGGDPTDAPLFLDGILANVEGVFGVMDGPDGDVNQDTRMMSAMLTKLSETGHAIMTVNGLGLNRTSILASEAGVPATDISRSVDTANGTIAVIRELDKLVLQIGDQRSVTVFANATPDMLFALKFWLESQKAQSVTIAPVSASILRN